MLSLANNRTTLLLVLALVGLVLLGFGAFLATTQTGILYISSVEDGPSPQLGIVLDKHLNVVYVEKSSAAELAGIQQGDILKKLGNTKLTNPNQARQTFSRADKANQIAVVVKRNQRKVKLKIPSPPYPSAARGGGPMSTATPVPPDLMYF